MNYNIYTYILSNNVTKSSVGAFLTFALLCLTAPVFADTTYVYDFTVSPTGDLGVTSQVFSPTSGPAGGPTITAYGVYNNNASNLFTSVNGLGLTSAIPQGTLPQSPGNQGFIQFDISNLLNDNASSITVANTGLIRPLTVTITLGQGFGGAPVSNPFSTQDVVDAGFTPPFLSPLYLNTSASLGFIYLTSLTVTIPSVGAPEPGTYLLLGSMLGLASILYWKKKKINLVSESV